MRNAAPDDAVGGVVKTLLYPCSAPQKALPTCPPGHQSTVIPLRDAAVYITNSVGTLPQTTVARAYYGRIDDLVAGADAGRIDQQIGVAHRGGSLRRTLGALLLVAAL